MAGFAVDLGEITVSLGQRDSGKSVLLEYLMTQMPRFVNIDHLFNHRVPGSVDVYEMPDFVAHWRQGNTRINIRDPNIKNDERLNEWLRLVAQIENLYLIIDELHKWTKANYIPTVLDDYVQTHSSHGNCGVIVACRVAKTIPTEVWSETDNYCIFHYGAGEDQKIKDLEIAPRFKRKIHDIDPNGHQFLFHRNRTGFTPRVVGPVPLPDHLKELG